MQYSSSSYALTAFTPASSSTLPCFPNHSPSLLYLRLCLSCPLTNKQPKQSPAFLWQWCTANTACTFSHFSSASYHYCGWRCSSYCKTTSNHSLVSTNGDIPRLTLPWHFTMDTSFLFIVLQNEKISCAFD